MAEEKRQGFLKGAAILSMSTIIVKAVGLIFSLLLAQQIGAVGVGYFNSAYGVFAVFNALATAGLPVAVSKMISSAYAVGKKKQADRIFSVAFIAFIILGLIFSLAMFFFSEQFAIHFIGSPGANFAIKALAPTVFFVCIMSAIRGYFQGRSHMTPTAISQIIESVAKVVIGLSLAMYAETRFQDSRLSAAAAILGVSASAALGAVYLLFYKRYKASREKNMVSPDRSVSSRQEIAKSLFRLAIPIAIGSCLLYILDMADTRIIYDRLQKVLLYSEEAATALYGIWGGALKLYDLPGSIVIALSSSILPVISGAFSRKEQGTITRMTTSGIRISFLITIPCSVGLIAFAGPLGRLFYSDSAESSGVERLLSLVAIGVVFNGTLYITNSIMQAQGRVNTPVINMVIGGVVRLVTNYILVGMPDINIAGAAISTVLSTFIMMMLNLIAVYRLVPKVENPLLMVLPMILSAAVMGACSYGAFYGLDLFLPEKISLALAIIVAVAVYFVMAVLTKAIKESDLRMLPKGDRLVRKLRIHDPRHFKT